MYCGFKIQISAQDIAKTKTLLIKKLFTKINTICNVKQIIFQYLHDLVKLKSLIVNRNV